MTQKNRRDPAYYLEINEIWGGKGRKGKRLHSGKVPVGSVDDESQASLAWDIFSKPKNVEQWASRFAKNRNNSVIFEKIEKGHIEEARVAVPSRHGGPARTFLVRLHRQNRFIEKEQSNPGFYFEIKEIRGTYIPRRKSCFNHSLE